MAERSPSRTPVSQGRRRLAEPRGFGRPSAASLGLDKWRRSGRLSRVPSRSRPESAGQAKRAGARKPRPTGASADTRSQRLREPHGIVPFVPESWSRTLSIQGMSSYVKAFTESVHLRRWCSCWELLRAIVARARLPRKGGWRCSYGVERPFRTVWVRSGALSAVLRACEWWARSVSRPSRWPRARRRRLGVVARRRRRGVASEL